MPYSNLSEDEQKRQRRIDYDLTFSTDHGFRVLQDLVLIACHLYQPSVNEDDQHPTLAYFREGERLIGLHIMQQLGHELRSKLL